MSRRDADEGPANLAIIGCLLNGRRPCDESRPPSQSPRTSMTCCRCECNEDVVAGSPTSVRGEVPARRRPPAYRNPLKKWRDNIQTRRSLGQRIMRNTGKAWAELLFNRTIHHRDREMVTRLFQHSDRVRATSAMAPGRYSAGEGKLCRCLPYDPNLEISGVPPISHAEMHGSVCVGCHSSWMCSQVLQQRMRQRRRELRSLVGHFSEIDCLQVVGNAKPITPVLVDPDYKDTCRGLCGNPQCAVLLSLQQHQRALQASAGGAEKGPAEVAKRKSANCCVSFKPCVSYEPERLEIRAEDLLASQQPFLEDGRCPAGSHYSTRSAAGSDNPASFMGGGYGSWDMHRKTGGRGSFSYAGKEPEADESDDDVQNSSASSSEEDSPSESSEEQEEQEEPMESVEPVEPQPCRQRRESEACYGTTKRSSSGRDGNCPECGRSPLNGSRNLLAGGKEKVPQTKIQTKLQMESDVRGNAGNRARSDQDPRNSKTKVERNVRNDRASPESVFRNEKDVRRNPDRGTTNERDVRNQIDLKSAKERAGRVNTENRFSKDLENRNKTENRPPRERDIQSPTENRPHRERDIQSPTEDRPRRERDIQSPTENRPPRERDIQRPTENRPLKDRVIQSPTENRPPRGRDIQSPTENRPPNKRDIQSPTENRPPNKRDIQSPAENKPPKERDYLRPTENSPPRERDVQANPPRERNVKSNPETQYRNEPYARSNPVRKSASDQIIMEDVPDDLDEDFRPNASQEGHASGSVSPTKKDSPVAYNNSGGFADTSNNNMPPVSEKKPEKKRFSVNLGVNKIILGVRGRPKKVESDSAAPTPESSRLVQEKARTNRPTAREHNQQPHQQPQQQSQQQPHQQHQQQSQHQPQLKPQQQSQHQPQQQPQQQSQQQPQSRYLQKTLSSKASPSKQENQSSPPYKPHYQVYQQSTSQPTNQALYHAANQATNKASNQPKTSSQSKPNNQSNPAYDTQPKNLQQQPNQHHQASSRQQQWTQQQSEQRESVPPKAATQTSAYGQKPPQAAKKEYRRVIMKKSLSDTHTPRQREQRPQVPPPKYVDSEKLLELANGALLTRQSSQRSLGGASQGSGVIGGGELSPNAPIHPVTKPASRPPSRPPSQRASKVVMMDGTHSAFKTTHANVNYEDEPPHPNGIYLSPSELSDFVRAEATQSGAYVTQHKSKTEYEQEVPLSTTNYVIEETTTEERQSDHIQIEVEEEHNDEIQIEVEGNERINIWINPKSDQGLTEEAQEGVSVDQMIAQRENIQPFYGDIRSSLTGQQQSTIVTDSARNSITATGRSRKSVVNSTEDGLEIEVDGTERISIIIKHREDELTDDMLGGEAQEGEALEGETQEVDPDDLPSKRTGGCCCKRNDPENPKCSAQCVEECASKPGICRRRRKNCGTFLFDSCFSKPDCQHSCCPTTPQPACCSPPQCCGTNKMPTSQPNECCYYPSRRYY